MPPTELDKARKGSILSEQESRKVLEGYGIPLVESCLADSPQKALEAAKALGFPVVLKGTGSEMPHKTELDVVRLNLNNQQEVKRAYREIAHNAGHLLQGVLVQRMIRSVREFVVGMKRDPQFGPCVMFGLGGILTEALRDVVFRVAPLEPFDAADMLDGIKAKKLLGPFRGQPKVDREKLERLLISVGKIGMEHSEISEIDINPVLIDGDRPVAVDALVVLG